ncbi:MAG: hypothetical protein P1V51_24315, partial [Deltaproteobacteria bacterium]|nr:hypothetical protein [Deltaproteobacteria bacterium]
MRKPESLLFTLFVALMATATAGCVIHQRPHGGTVQQREISREEANTIAFDFVRSHGYAFAKLAGTARDAGYWRVHLSQRMPSAMAELDVWVDVRTGYVADSTLHRQGRTSGTWSRDGGYGTSPGYSTGAPPPRGQPAPPPQYAPAPGSRPPSHGHAAQPATTPAQPARPAQPAQPATRPAQPAQPAQ